MEELVGGFLIIEAMLSIFLSSDQRAISNIGRGSRILAGLWIIRQGATFKQVEAGGRYDGVKRKQLKRARG